jgi:hypothetical protein
MILETNLSALWTYSQSPVLKGDQTYSVEKKSFANAKDK